MNSRTIRRALERKAQKQANKAAAKAVPAAAGSFAAPETIQAEAIQQNGQLGEVIATFALPGPVVSAAPEPRRPISELQLAANRRNAALSSGPVTAEGKLRSSRNALKTGLTGKAVLLSTDDAALYEHHVASFFDELNPLGDRETELVQSIADSKWRLARIPSLEFGIYALGRIEFAEEFQNLPKAEAAALIEAKTFMAYQRQLSNLSIQESRLRRQTEKDTAELSRLQQIRAAAARAEAAARKTAAPTLVAQPRPQTNGFEFSNSPFEAPKHGRTADSGLLNQTQAA